MGQSAHINTGWYTNLHIQLVDKYLQPLSRDVHREVNGRCRRFSVIDNHTYTVLAEEAPSPAGVRRGGPSFVPVGLAVSPNSQQERRTVQVNEESGST